MRVWVVLFGGPSLTVVGAPGMARQKVTGGVGAWPQRPLHVGRPVDRANVRFEFRAAAATIYLHRDRRIEMHAEVDYTSDLGARGTVTCLDVL